MYLQPMELSIKFILGIKDYLKVRDWLPGYNMANASDASKNMNHF